ncbi:hypothetical protein V6N12_017990 [Hibiscus sabdariffa]|uniref:Uncharacterized protein n=1 Tax=Hibiscus sabdariffa TaxID=183260 RepID=A0ABR2ATN4_9ROSI
MCHAMSALKKSKCWRGFVADISQSPLFLLRFSVSSLKKLQLSITKIASAVISRLLPVNQTCRLTCLLFPFLFLGQTQNKKTTNSTKTRLNSCGIEGATHHRQSLSPSMTAKTQGVKFQQWKSGFEWEAGMVLTKVKTDSMGSVCSSKMGLLQCQDMSKAMSLLREVDKEVDVAFAQAVEE